MKKLFNQKGFTLSIFSAIIGVLIMVLIGSNIYTGYLLYKNKKTEKLAEINNVASNTAQQAENNNTNPNVDSADSSVVNTAEQKIELTKDDTTGEVNVDWVTEPIKISSYKDVLGEYYNDHNLTEQQLKHLNEVNYYKVGRVNGGKYDGKNFFVMNYSVPFGYNIIRGIKDGGNIIVLKKYSDDIYNDPEGMTAIDWGLYIQKFIINDNLTIANFDLPESIKIPNSNILLIKSSEETKIFVTDSSNLKKLFQYEDGKYVYKDETNCYIVRAKDGTGRQYHFDISFLEKKEDGSELKGGSPNLNNITWNNGGKNKNDYFFQTPGQCGYADCYSYALYIKDELQIKVAGKTSNGGVVYEFANVNDKKASEILKGIYNEYGQYRADKETYEKFLNNHPLFFWQDPFGDYIAFTNSAYQSGVECGKPVIYLYPEKESDIFVWVNPTGGFKITEPVYNNGWQVKAKPNGEIYNYDDNKMYPYLFWEGYGLNYERPQEGFVVSKDEVEEFLNEKLIKLGLIKKEADEFIEFWLPRMQEKNYYFITFVPQAEFDKLAPLAVSPKPDTVIRVFMDYEGLDEHREVEAQKIITPKRKGFVVTEWGGAMHK